MPIIRNLFPNEFDKDIDEVFHDHLMEYPSEYEAVAKVESIGKQRFYIASQISGIGEVQVISEGGRVTYDVPVEGHRKSVQAVKYGLGVQITEESIDDDFHGKLMQTTGTLADSAKDKMNEQFFSLFNDGNTTQTAWDGLSIFNNSHVTLKSGTTIDNLSTAALSETALQAAFEYFYGLVDEAGRKINVRPDCLLVPEELRWTAHRLAQQMGGITATAANSPNVSGNIMTTNPDYGIVDPWSVMVSRYLDDANDWFFMSKKDHQMKMLVWKAITLESDDDFQTGSRQMKVTTRFKEAAFDYKPVYGAFVS